MPRGALPPKRCSRIGARRGPAQAIGARAGGSGRHAQAARASTPTARTAHRRAVEIIPEPKVHYALAAVPALPRRLTKKKWRRDKLIKHKQGRKSDQTVGGF